jgi:hypothetical protein
MSMLGAYACAQAADFSTSPVEIILGTSSPDLLLMRGDVRDDLQLSSEQSIKILTIQSSFQDESSKISPPTTEEDDGTETSYDALRKYAIDQVDQVLSPEQMKRLKQISLQLTGYSALAGADVQKQFDLSKDLQIKIYDLANEEQHADDSVMDKYENGDLTPDQMPTIIKKNRQVLNAELSKILPESVKDKFKSLGGRTFKTSTTP